MTLRYSVLPFLLLLILSSGGSARASVYIGLATGVEGYAESDHNSYTANRELILGWRGRKWSAPARQGVTDVHARVVQAEDKDPEKSDSERYRDSTRWFADVVRPFHALSSGPRPWLLAAWGWLEGAENHQQLEEREYMGAAGLGLDKRIGTGGQWDIRAGLALACNEEEKDDDWPRENFDIGRDQLGRRGCGWFGRWNNQVRLPTGTVLGAKLDYYDGRFDYGTQDYRRGRAELYMRVPLVSPSHMLRVSGRTIRRHAELDLLGFEDQLNQVGLAYWYRF